MRTPIRHAWQALLRRVPAFAVAARLSLVMTARADDAQLPSLPPTAAADPAIVQTLGDSAFRVPAEIASARMSPDGGEIFAAHENESRISILDAKTGAAKIQIPLLGQGFDLSPDGHMLAGIRESYENEKLRRPFGVWKWPERTVLWTSDKLGMPGASRFSPDGKMLAVLGSVPGLRAGSRVIVLEAATGREIWRAESPEIDNPFGHGLAWMKNDWLMATLPKKDERGVQIFRATDGHPVEVESEALANTVGKESLAAALHAPLIAIHDDLHFEVVRWNGDDQLESILRHSVEDGYDTQQLIQGADISPDGRFLFIATRSACSIYDLEKRALLRKVPQRSSLARFSADGETVITALHSGVALLAANTWTQRLPATPPAHVHSIDQVLFSPDGTLLASNDGGQILLWDWRNGKVRARIPRPTPRRDFMDMVFHPKETLLVAGDGVDVFWWDFALVPANASGLALDAAEPAHKRMLHMTDPPSHLNEHHLRFDAAGKKLLFTTNSFASVIELTSDPRAKGERIRQLTVGPFERYGYINNIALRPDGRRFSIVGNTHFRSFDLESGEKTGEWKMGTFGGGPFSPDGRWLATIAAGQGSDLAIFDTESGAVEMSLPVSEAKGHLSRLLSGARAWAGDGSRLACSAYNGLLGWSGFSVWDMKSGRALGTQATNRGRIRTLALSADGRHLAAANADGSIQIWDLDKAFHR